MLHRGKLKSWIKKTTLLLEDINERSVAKIYLKEEISFTELGFGP